MTLAVDDDGVVHTWGDYSNGIQGGGADPTVAPGAVDPNHVEFASSTRLAVHALAVTENGNIYAWGQGYNGALGNNGVDNEDEPVQVLVP